ncbi:unnamed protein product [Bursaphelenchus okinawaensis]|uniref:Uncharacterized protein n=1 Tax=Bursaphelenchus okinawaensis TaxID=465554 RepID=A0A811L3V6_9BILA|nr:unnamed protein product [Bursaphelenchus okinawaensis]CAG9116824.1 unnamed protein product [Bursaphelenchus okinawaensis]
MIKSSDKSLRIRYVDSTSIPVLERVFEREKVFLVDKVDGAVIPRKVVQQAAKTVVKQELVKSVDNGLQLVGDPLEVSMIDLDLETERIGECIYGNGLDKFQDRIDIQPLSHVEAANVIRKVSDTAFKQKLAGISGVNSLKEFNMVVCADSADVQNVVVYAVKVTKEEIVEYHVRLLGNLNDGMMQGLARQMMIYGHVENVTYHAIYEDMNGSFGIPTFSSWLRPISVVGFLGNEDDLSEQDKFEDEMVRASFKFDVEWKESAKVLENFVNYWETTKKNGTFNAKLASPFELFQTPDTLGHVNLTITPGWLDPRINDFDRSMKLRFLHNLAKDDNIQWPMKEIQLDLVNKFKESLNESVWVKHDEFDVIEAHWDYFAAARSTATLREMFSHIITMSEQKNITVANVHVDNKSELARSVIKTSAIRRLTDSRIIEYLIEVGMDRFRRELLIAAGSKRPEIEPHLEDLSGDYEVMMHQLLMVHLALQGYEMCLRRIDNVNFVDKLFGKFLQTFEKVNFDNIKDFVLSVQVPVSNLTKDLFHINNVLEWSVNTEFCDSATGRNNLHLHVCRNQELRSRVEPKERRVRIRRCEMAVPELAKSFNTYLTESSHNENCLNKPLVLGGKR